MTRKRFVVASVAAAALWVCAEGRVSAAPAGRPPGKGKASAVTAPEEHSRKVILSIDNQPVLTVAKFQRILDREEYRHVRAFSGPEAAKRQAMEDTLSFQLVVREATAKSVDREPEFALPMQTVRKGWLGSLYLKDLKGKIRVPDEEIGKRAPKGWEFRRFSQVTVPGREQAEALRDRVLSGETIEGIARRESIDPAAVKGGDLGEVDSSQAMTVPPLVQQEMWDLEVGKCTDTFPSLLGYGYSFACLTGVRPFTEAERKEREKFLAEEVRGEILEEIRRNQRRSCDVRVEEGPLRDFAGTGPDTLLARANDHTITRGYLDAYLAARGNDKIPADPKGRADFLDRVGQELCDYDLAVAVGLDRNPEFEEAFRDYSERKLANFYMGRIYSSLTVPDADARKFYEQNRGMMVSPKAVLARVVVTADRPTADNVYGMVRTGKIRFEDAVLKYSVDRSTKISGGYIGYVVEGTPPKLSVYGNALALHPGEIGGPFEEKGRYFVMTVTDRQERKELSYEDAEGKIKAELLEKAREEARTREIGRLKKTHTYWIDKRFRPEASAVEKGGGAQ